MASEIYTLTSKLVSEKQQELVNLIVQWSFISVGPPFETQKYDGTPIRYQGIKFKGSPRDVFWSGYIEPYLENYGLEILDQVCKASFECGVNIDDATVEGTACINGMISTVYNQMARVDSKLMGNGFKPAEKRDVSGHISMMKKTINGHANIINKKYKNMKKNQNTTNVTNNFNSTVENVQTGNQSTQVNVKSSTPKAGVFKWVLDHLISVIVAGVAVVFISTWLGLGVK